MIVENSGKVYRFKLEHDLGYGFAEIYDFTDYSMFDGRLVYVYNRLDIDERPEYNIIDIRKSGIALGPIRLYKFPAARGLHSWKYLFTADELLTTEIPVTKELQSMHSKEDNWANFKWWYYSNQDKKQLPTYVDYEKVRHLETRIINAPSGVVRESTMKVILDRKENVSDYYDLSQQSNKNLFVYLINTYYPLSKTKQFLKQLPPKDN